MISHFHHSFVTNEQQCNDHIFGKILFHQIVLKMWWKCDKCKKKLEEGITFSSQFCHYVMKFVKFPDLSSWAKLRSLYLITLLWKCDENVMNCIWYSFFGSYHLKIPASQKTSCSFTMGAFTLAVFCFSDNFFIHHSVEHKRRGNSNLRTRKKVHTKHISMTKPSQFCGLFLISWHHILVT